MLQVICSIKAVKSLKVVLTQATAHIEYDMGQDGQENIKTIRLVRICERLMHNIL